MIQKGSVFPGSTGTYDDGSRNESLKKQTHILHVSPIVSDEVHTLLEEEKVPFSLYHIPGKDTITLKSFARYIKSSQSFIPASSDVIYTQALEGIEKKDPVLLHNIQEILRMLDSKKDRGKKHALIAALMESKDPLMQLRGVEMVEYASQDNTLQPTYEELLQKARNVVDTAFASDDFDQWMSVANVSERTGVYPTNQITESVSSVLQKALAVFHEEKKTRPVEETMLWSIMHNKNNNAGMMTYLRAFFNFTSDSLLQSHQESFSIQIRTFLEQVLSFGEESEQMLGVTIVSNANISTTPSIVAQLLASSYPRVQLEGAKHYNYLPRVRNAYPDGISLSDIEDQIFHNAEKALAAPDQDTQYIGMEMASHLPACRKFPLIVLGLTSPYFVVQERAALFMPDAKSREQYLKGDKFMTEMYERTSFISSYDARDKNRQSPVSRAFVFKTLKTIQGQRPEFPWQTLPLYARVFPTRKTLIQALLMYYVQQVRTRTLPAEQPLLGQYILNYVPQKDSQQVIQDIIQKYPNVYAGTPFVSYNSKLPDDTFVRKKRAKTGAEMTVFGGKLRDAVVVRHFSQNRFLERKKLYENYTLWRDSGFDYVPIEPILSFTSRPYGMVDVSAAVLDGNYHTRRYSFRLGLFEQELKKDFIKITDVLESIGFQHGHNNGGQNTVLRFFRNTDGSIDFTKKPRLYVIDFDAAQSKEA